MFLVECVLDRLLCDWLVSEWSRRTVVSPAVLFLAAGFLTGPAGLGLVHLEPASSLISGLTNLALFSILFSGGMKLDLGELRRRWRLRFRALAFAMRPLPR